MAERQQYSRIFARLAGPIQVGRHQQARQALEDDFLDDVTGPLDAAGDPRIQRTAVIGESADQLKNLGPDLGLAALCILDVAHGADSFCPGIELFLGDPIHPVEETAFSISFLGKQGRGEEQKRP